MPLRTTNPPRYRLAGFQLALLGWAVLVMTRLFYLQVLDHHWLMERALHQQREAITVAAHRGAIYDRNLTPLAMSLPVESLYATPRAITAPRATARALARALGLDEAAEAKLEKLLGSQHSFAWVKRQVTADEGAAVNKLHLKGIYSQPDTRRFYPKGDLAASVLGFVGVDGRGLAGLEYAFNGLMSGRDGKAVLEVDARRQSYAQIAQPPQEGASLVLTIDQNIQYIAQQELDQTVKATHALRGTVVIENPQNGEILALANSPTFNPDDYRHTPPSRLGDPAVSEPYEPGSVFKLVTISAALQQRLVTPEEMINCQMGSIEVGGRLIHDHAQFGVISVSDILRHSSDVGAIKIGLKLGDEEFYRYIRAYGFGQLTGIGLPGESAGIVRPPREWQPMSIGAVSMGQEVAATPIQILAMISALADGGVYHAPQVVMGSFRGAAPQAAPAFTPAPGRRIVSPVVANEMKQMMAQVVLAGTAQQAQLNGYTAGGKTGTAQKVDPGTHAYSKRDYIASFGGFAPLNDPAVAILVVIDSPRGGHEGGATAGPVFKRIAERVLPYLGVPHDVPVEPPPPAFEAHRADPRDSVEESERVDQALVPDAAAQFKAAALKTAAPSPSGAAAKPGMVILDYGPGRVAPDFTGKTVRAVSDICERMGLDPTLLGSGVARAQAPAPGARLEAGSRVVVQFSP